MLREKGFFLKSVNKKSGKKYFVFLLCIGLLFSFGCKKDESGSNIPQPGQSSSSEEPSSEDNPPDTRPPYAIKIQDAKWDSTYISDAILWMYYQFNDLFTARESITVFEMDLNNEKIGVKIPYVTTGHFQTTSDGAASVSASAAINGSYFDTKNGGSTTFFRHEGDVISYTTKAAWRSNAGFSIDKDGKISIIKEPSSGWNSTSTYSLLASGPLLIYNSEIQNQKNTAFNYGRNPRTAIGLTADNRLIAVVVDGRFSQSAGMSNKELSKVMKALGCTVAMNLDGGGSSTAWVRNLGVVNYPSDNGKFDHGGERKVATVIAFTVEK